MEYNNKCISSRFLELTYPTFKYNVEVLVLLLHYHSEVNGVLWLHYMYLIPLVTLAEPAQMIGRAFYSTTASTDDILLWIFCQSTSDIHCYRDVKSIPWNIT